jgi:ParB family transcriptional regulator, chromosome partitioning protein
MMSTDSSKKPRRLGRGLSALIENPAPVVVETKAKTLASSELPEADSPGLTQIPLDQIQPSPYQPRHSFDEAELENLAQSIRQAGVIQPIVVRQTKHTTNSYELVAGERRWRAARLAGLGAVPSVVVTLEDHEAAEWALIENLQRKDLNAIERAHALRGLCEKFGLTHQQLAERVGLDRSTVANLIRVTELAEPIQELIAAGELTIGHGKALLSIGDPALRLRLARQAASEHWTVRKLEQHDKPTVLTEGDPAARVASPTLADLERQLSEHLGTRVRISTTRDGSRGRLSMEFYSLDHFDGLLAKFGYTDNEI